MITILTSLKNKEGKNLVTKTEAENLSNLTFESGEKILSKEHGYFNYEVAWMLNQVGYEKTYNFLSAGWDKVFGIEDARKKMLFENPLMSPAKEKFILDMNIYKERITVEAGEKCRKCGSTETISTSKQTRSADEAATIKVQCLQCKFRWTAQ